MGFGGAGPIVARRPEVAGLELLGGGHEDISMTISACAGESTKVYRPQPSSEDSITSYGIALGVLPVRNAFFAAAKREDGAIGAVGLGSCAAA